MKLHTGAAFFLASLFAAAGASAQTGAPPAAAPAAMPGSPMKQTKGSHMGIVKTPWGKTQGQQDVDLYTLSNGNLTAKIATYGATLVAMRVPDRSGKIADVVLGFDTLEGYADSKNHNNYYGATIGRYANRIKKAQFTLDGVTYHLPADRSGNILHGGSLGFDKRVWHAVPHDGANPSLVLTYTSLDGEQNFPGNLKVKVTYTLEKDRLRIRWDATTDKPTVINLTNHSYFNLKGAGEGDVLDHRVMINADAVTLNDRDATANGQIEPVAGTAFDFRTLTLIGAHIHDSVDPQMTVPHGYDQNFIINGAPGKLRVAARIEETTSGRVLECWTTQPGVQLYTNNTRGTVTGKGGAQFLQYGAFTLETQHPANAPNIPSFPSTVLRPGQAFHEETEFRFSTLKQ